MKTNKEQEYALAITDAILGIFRDEEDGCQLHHYDLNEIDATKFFTGMIMACGLIFNKITGDYKTPLEFTYLANQLIVQYMMEDAEDEMP